MDFDIPVDHRVNSKESKKGDEYLDIAKELKNYGTKSDGDIYCN